MCLNLCHRPQFLYQAVCKGFLLFNSPWDDLEETLLDRVGRVQSFLLPKVIYDALEGFVWAICCHGQLGRINVRCRLWKVYQTFLYAVFCFQISDVFANLKSIVVIHGSIIAGHINHFYLDVTVIFQSFDLSRDIIHVLFLRLKCLLWTSHHWMSHGRLFLWDCSPSAFDNILLLHMLLACLHHWFRILII